MQGDSLYKRSQMKNTLEIPSLSSYSIRWEKVSKKMVSCIYKSPIFSQANKMEENINEMKMAEYLFHTNTQA